MVLRKNRTWQRGIGGLLCFTLFSALFAVDAPGSKAGREGVFLAAERGAKEERQAKETFFELTQEEEEYLAGLRGQTLFVGVSGTGVWEIRDGVDCGVVAPLVDVLHYEFGLELRLVQGTWEENRAAMQDGGLDFLVGVPAERWEKAGDEEAPDLPESGMYCSAWLYENPYVIVEYTGKVSNGRKESSGTENDNVTGEENPDEQAVDEGEAGKEETNPDKKATSETGTGSDGKATQGKTGSNKEAVNERGTSSNKETVDGKQGGVLAYIKADPVCEEMIPYILQTPGRYMKRADTANGLEILPCTDEDGVFAALENGQADIGILPEEALFLCYPALDFSVIAHLGAYGSKVAVGIGDQRLLPLLEILNRYLETTEEGEALREAMRVQQQGIRAEKIWQQEGEILQKLQARGENLPYAQAGLDAVPYFWHDENKAYGELPEFLSFLSECTGLALKESSLFGEKALQALEEEELLFVTGMPLVGNGQAYCFAEAYAADSLVPVIPAKDAGQYDQEAIASHYWGIAQELMPFLEGTVFEGHAVEFVDERMLCEAMRAGEIGGMLITQGSFDALLLTGEEAYAMVQGIAFPVRSGMVFSEADQDAAEFFGRMWQFYRLFHREGASAGEQYRAAYAQARAVQEDLTRLSWILGVAVLVLAAAFLLALRRGGKKKRSSGKH